tara:strand:+ start:70613 stop:71539 length:927 start_codon:yes stop_codon:yes gene_type:complete
MQTMTNIKRVSPGVPTGGEFASHNRSDSDIELSSTSRTFGSVDELRGNDRAVTAMTVAAAGEHHMLLKVDPDAADEARGVVDALARATGKHVVVVPAETHSSDLLGFPGKPGLFEQADGGILYIPDAQSLFAAELDLLRAPLEAGSINYARGGESHHVPADFQLVLGVTQPREGTPPAQARREQNRINGPIRDRMGLITPVVPTDPKKPAPADEQTLVSSTAAARERIAAELQGTPWTKLAHVPGAYLRGPIKKLSSELTRPMDRALERGGITMRGYDRALRSAFTRAAIDGTPVTAEHISAGLTDRI